MGPYETEEAVTNDYEVWDDDQVAGYMDPGTYRWEERIRIFTAGDGENASGDKEQLGSFHWGFGIDVSIPDDE